MAIWRPRPGICVTTVPDTAIADAGGPLPTPTGVPARWREWVRERVDLFIASDPGANRLINAVSAGMSIGLNLAVVCLFEQSTHLMWTVAPAGAQLSANQAAALAEQHHGITILMMLLGGIVGMLASNIVQEPKARQQALSLIVVPLPMIGAMALAIWLAPHHWVGVEVMAAVLALGTWLRRFIPQIGPRAMLWGALLFIGYMIGFLASAELSERDLGDLALVVLLAAAGVFTVKTVFSNPLARGRLNRTATAFRARCRAVMAASVVVFDAEDADERRRGRRRLHRSLRRLNETALLIDASLAEVDPAELDRDATAIQDELFGIELLVQNVGRIAEVLAVADLGPVLRAEVRAWLDDLRLGYTERAGAATRAFQEHHVIERVEGLADADAARVRRLAMTIRQVADLSARLPQERAGAPAVHNDPFSSPVSLMMGDLPGSALVARQVSGEVDSGPWWRRLDPATQTALRMGLAVAAAGSLASLASERRFYWAVIAVFITFMGTNTAGEQILKSGSRVLGTIVGIFIGSLLAHAIGLSTWSLAVVLPMMMVSMYFIKVSYGIAVIGITVSVTQLYVQLGEYSSSLLLLRLGLTGIGAGVAMAAALLVFPVPTRRVVGVAARSYVETLADVLGRVRERLTPGHAGERLVGAVRALDFAASQLAAASRPLRYAPYKPQHLEFNVALMAQTAHQAQNIAAIIQSHDSFDPLSSETLAGIVEKELAAVRNLGDALHVGTPPSQAHRLGDSEIAALDKALRDAHVSADGYQRMLLFQLDRLDETVAELHQNIASLAV